MILVRWSVLLSLFVTASSFYKTQRLARPAHPVSQLSLSSSSRPTIASPALDSGSSNDTYLRWRKDGDTWNIETAVTSFQRGGQSVELHAQVHFADKSYFDYYNSPQFDGSLDTVLFELLVDDDLLQYEGGRWRVKTPIMASPNDQNLAKQYGWECQASQVDYTNAKWIHADLSRQEFLRLTETDSAAKGQPLWKLASGPASSSAAAEAVSALLVGPPTLSYSNPLLKRRLFTNLFLPGGNFATALRALLWMTVPCPELSILLLDWSSLLKGGSNPNALSEVALPILSSMVKFDIPQIRRFLFGQVLMSSNNAKRAVKDESSAWSLLVTKRNDRALDVLKTTLSDSAPDSSAALLYGSSHCPDLHARLVADGFGPTKTTWRTAWSVRENEEDSAFIPAIMAVLVFYLGVGALDWVATIGDVSQGWVDSDVADSGAAMGLYLVRHVLLYIGLSKFLVDWTNSND
jgi:hypothetical protein